MASSICWNSARGTIASAIWKVIERPCRTIFAPIFTSRSRNVAIDQWPTASGSARVRRKLASGSSLTLGAYENPNESADFRQTSRIQTLGSIH